MRQIQFSDGTPSREVEEEWEQLHAIPLPPCMSSVTIRDHLTNLRDLLNVCQEALLNSEHIKIKEMVGCVLMMYSDKELESIDEELKLI
jgi:hypothetical protein